MSRTSRVLAALLAGLVLGLGVRQLHRPALNAIVDAVEPIGTMWVNAIRMTVVPMVVALLITGIASMRDVRLVRALGVRTLATFLGLLAVAAALGLAVAPWLFHWLRVDAATVAAMRPVGLASVDAATAEIPTFAQWVTAIVPVNPVKAAADGALLPLLVFAVCFGMALLHVRREQQAAVVAFFAGVGDAMLGIVSGVIALAPIGVFALMLPVASRTGVAAAGALGYYIVAIAAASGIAIAVLYPIAWLVGGVPIARFARAALPAQAVAFSSSSSLASLPALVEAGERQLALPADSAGVVLPLAVSSFKVTGPLVWIVAALFLARLYGVSIGAAQLLGVALSGAVASFSAPGVPHGWLLVIAPLLASLGVPPEGVGLLIAVDAIPDMCITTANVTADLAAAAIAARHAKPRPADVG